MQHIFDYGAERRGVLLAHRLLKDMINTAELLESNNSRRYKLLKFMIESNLKDPDYILKYRERKKLAYKFEKGEFIAEEALSFREDFKQKRLLQSNNK